MCGAASSVHAVSYARVSDLTQAVRVQRLIRIESCPSASFRSAQPCRRFENRPHPFDPSCDFDAYFRASTPDWREILARLGHVETELGTEQGNHRHRKIFDEWLGCRGEAEHRFRSALCSRELTPLVRDPQTGETLALGRDWERTGTN
jgi:hypothetical protein